MTAGESSGAGAIFAASGGVLEAALRTAADASVEYKDVRGVERGVKAVTIEGFGTVAAVTSIGSAIAAVTSIGSAICFCYLLISNDDWKKQYLMIEILACPGGCLGGGGDQSLAIQIFLRSE
jgi:NADH-quinone oxidoreductase subunit G